MPNQSSRNSATKRVRPRHRIAFAFESRSQGKIQTSLDARFSKLLTRRPEFQNVRIAVGKPGELTLSGRVPSSTAKRIATAMVRMEQGVRKVTNQLNVLDSKAQPKTDSSPSSSQSPAK
jgi:osmotically-inducible protein OsmY